MEATDNETSAGDMDYIVQYSGNGTSNWVTVGTLRGETSLDISIENLEETESGRVRVRAKDSIGNWSAWAVSGAIRIIKIREPEIEVIPIGSDRMEIRWSIPPGPDVPGVTYDLDAYGRTGKMYTQDLTAAVLWKTRVLVPTRCTNTK